MESSPDSRNMHISQDGRGQPNPHSFKELAGRGAWAATYWSIYRWIPRHLNWWHRSILRVFGAKVGRAVTVYPSAHITCPWNLILKDYCVIGPGVELFALGTITIGKHSVLSQRAHLCAGTHDYTDPRMPLLRLPIRIGDGAWICAEVFIGPGVNVGDRSVVGARSVVIKDLPPDSVCAGNPCRTIRPRVMRTGQ